MGMQTGDIETVKVHISIQIDTEADIDTGLTVAGWNGLTEDQRAQIVTKNWENLAQCDNGGAYVITKGAEEV